MLKKDIDTSMPFYHIPSTEVNHYLLIIFISRNPSSAYGIRLVINDRSYEGACRDRRPRRSKSFFDIDEQKTIITGSH